MDTNRYTAIVGKWSPVAGLAGTIFGMLRMFQHIAHPPNDPYFSNLVPCIGEALLLTMAMLLFVNAFAVITTVNRE